MDNNQEVTYYRFLSEIKAFLGKLLSDPIKAEPSKYLKNLGFTRSRIINLLLRKDILERNEKILTPDKTGLKKVKYCVTFKVKKKNFERIMRRIYIRYFEKNLPENLNESSAKDRYVLYADTMTCGNSDFMADLEEQVEKQNVKRALEYLDESLVDDEKEYSHEDIEKKGNIEFEKDGYIFVRYKDRDHEFLVYKKVKSNVNEMMDMTSCANINGVTSDPGGRVDSEMCDRWATWVNDAKDKPRSLFANEDKMKEDILKNKQDREAYLTRGGMKGIDECEVAGATSCTSSGQFVQPLTTQLLTRKQLGQTNKISEKKNNSAMGKRIYLTEEQLNYIIKEEAIAAGGATSTSSVGAETTRGDMGYDAPAFGKSKNTNKNKKEKGTDSDFFKPAMERKPGFSCKKVGDGK